MCRLVWWGLLSCLVVTAPARAQDGPAVVPLLEDDPGALIEHLQNDGLLDASVAGRADDTRFAGTSALSVTQFQRFASRVPGWGFAIAERPGPGEYRYVRFAWRRTEGPAIMLQLHAAPGGWHRYYAGDVPPDVQAWGAMTRLADAPPRAWTVVTRDLFADFGPMTITGISFTALEGGGLAYYDHIYLGRTVADLDRVTGAQRAETDPAEPPSTTGGRAALVGAAAAVLALVVVLAWLARRQQPAPTAATPVGLACPACGKRLRVDAATAGKRVKCPACGSMLPTP